MGGCFFALITSPRRGDHRGVRSLAIALVLALFLVGTAAAEPDFPGLQTGVSLDRLDAARRISDRRVWPLAAAAKQKGLTAGRATDFKRPRNPHELVGVLRANYGPDSILTMSAESLAAIVKAAERGAQGPLDGVNAVAGGLAKRSGSMLGVSGLRLPKLQTKLSHRHAGVRLSTRW